MGFNHSNDSELVKTAFDYGSNLFVKAKMRVKDDTQVSGVGFDVGRENTWVGCERGFRFGRA